jgi:alkylated DNA repair dioxygenase AlkB
MNQLSLFDQTVEPGPPSALIDYRAQVFSEEESHLLFQKFASELPWEQTTRIMYGKKIITPRLTLWLGDPEANYSLSKLPAHPLPWTEDLLIIKNKVDELAGVVFNTVLLNYYRDGNDSVAWHSDNDGVPGRNKIVASLSFGQTRIFEFRNRKDHRKKYSLSLENGSYLLMKGNFQDEWEHRIPKSPKIVNARINLTFRVMPRAIP